MPFPDSYDLRKNAEYRQRINADIQTQLLIDRLRQLLTVKVSSK